ncbi:LIC_13387 family protein [Shewanella baltica]|uniref:LIC_13387 family protein n=1 Tax=Shewanella baltica TaxID=62322 RepID=UPI00325E9F57
MISQALLIIGASIFGMLGFVHLIYTFFTDKFNAHNPDVTEAMKSTSPNITKETTVWRAWIGFNASHSLGAIFFAAIYIPLAFSHIEFIVNNSWFAVLPSIVGLSYLLLAKNYWFKIPFFGILFSTISFIGAFVLINR